MRRKESEFWVGALGGRLFGLCVRRFSEERLVLVYEWQCEESSLVLATHVFACPFSQLNLAICSLQSSILSLFV